MNTDKRGFTIVEIAVVILIGSILMSMALRGFGDTSSRLAAQNASQVFGSLHARARAMAVERGEIVRFRVDPAGDSVWIESDQGRVESRHFDRTMDVDIQGIALTLCMNPQGFGETGCNDFSGSEEIRFVQGGRADTVEVFSMGQLRW